jgi:hypothetical protein
MNAKDLAKPALGAIANWRDEKLIGFDWIQ